MQTNDVRDAGGTAALENLVPELVKLEQLLAGARKSKLRALRDFATANSDLQRLEEMLAEAKAQPAQFDLLQVIRPSLWEYEDVHSNIVAWLLDPRQSHGIGQYFLKNFLFRSCRTAGRLGMSAIAPARIHSIDWSKTEVRREWRYIDILILNREARFVCAIENKIFASEGIGNDGISQLTWYRQTLAEEFPDFTKHLVFLDFKSGNPSENEQPYWTPENYITILELVEQTIDAQATALSEDVRVFLRQYATTLRKRGKVVPDNSELQRLARKIYLEHREAVELLYRNKPDYRNEMKRILKESISTHTDWKLYADDASFVYFQPSGFTQYQGMQPGESHARYSLVGCEFQCPQEGNARFRVEIAPETESNKFVRDRIVDTINQHPGVFNSAGQVATGWMSVHWGDYILDDGDLSKWDDPSTRAKIEAWVKDFAENEFPAMNEVIVKCLQDYEAERPGQ